MKKYLFLFLKIKINILFTLLLINNIIIKGNERKFAN